MGLAAAAGHDVALANVESEMTLTPAARATRATVPVTDPQVSNVRVGSPPLPITVYSPGAVHTILRSPNPLADQASVAQLTDRSSAASGVANKTSQRPAAPGSVIGRVRLEPDHRPETNGGAAGSSSLVNVHSVGVDEHQPGDAASRPHS